MARIVLVYDRFHPQLGGMERLLEEVGSTIAERHDVTVLSASAAALRGITYLKGIRTLRQPPWSPAVGRVIAEADLVLGFGYTPHSLRALFPLQVSARVLSAGTPLAWCPTYLPANAPTPVARSLLRPLRRIARAALDAAYRRTFRRTVCLFAFTPAELEYWKSNLPGVPVRKLPHGVRASHAQCATHAEVHCRATDGATVLCVGRIVGYKNQAVVVRAMATVRRRFPTARLLLVGPGEERTVAALRKLAHDARIADAVVITGAVSDEEICRHYASAACIVQPSRHEVSGLTPLEALAHGTPVLHSGQGGMARYTELPGCRRVDALDDPGPWAQAIIDILDSPAKANAAASEGRRRVLAEHTWEQMAKVIESYLHVDTAAKPGSVPSPALGRAR